MELKFITRTADTPPLGKPRVFFCASKHDFDIYFETMSKDILDILNCAIYYLDYEDNYKNDSELFELLDSMQLFVVPITSELLLEEANDIREYLLKHYIEQKQKIIIPIVVEEIDANKLALFEQYFGKIQFLDQTGLNDQAKGTQIPYKVKLETTLKNILVGDKLAQEIRDAFDIHIFLSYRKKDRKDAQKLMHLIHSDPTCEDLAIWYDEKLVPGESYDSQISNEMKNCDLFIFNVTESFLETGNYVVTTEYPTANNYGKPIIPVEMRSTDKDKLNEMFDGIIPKLITVDEHSKICPMTLESIKNIERNERINDAKHLFFLGLAYLNGIDVEVDEEHGKRLLLSAAEQGLPEAMEKLAHLAFDGKKDPNIAVASCWQKRAVETYKEQLLQALTDIDLFERFQEATEYLIQLYSCNNEVKGFSFCTETVEELAALYNKHVSEQPETYKDFFQKIQYLRIHAASHCDDIDQKRQIANDVEASYMEYFALSHNVEDAGTLIDLLCTLSREMKTGLHFAYNKIESIKAKFCDLLSELVLCTMYVKVCRTFVDFEKVSPGSPDPNIKIDDSIMNDEFGWWRYAKEAYALCLGHIHAAPEDLEWKKLYCESLYVLGVGATKVLDINSASFTDQTLIDDCNHYADEYDRLYPDIMKLEDYDAKCSYIDAALNLAYWQYPLSPISPDITDDMPKEQVLEIYEPSEVDNEKAELTVVEKYQKALSLAAHLCEEYQTRESLIYYWSKLNYCTNLCFLNDEANEFREIIAEKSLMLAQDIHQREHSIQASIRLADSLESFFHTYDYSHKEGIFEKLQEAISIYQELVNKGLSKEFHCKMEKRLWKLYETAYVYMGKKAQEEEAIKYLLSSTELSKKMVAEHNKLPGDFPLKRLGYLASSEYEHYNTIYDEVEKEVADFKEKITSENSEKRLEENDFTSLLHMADDYYKKKNYDSALNLYKKLDGNSSITRYEKMFTCMKYLHLTSDMISIYPKVVEELKQGSSSSQPKAIAKIKRAISQFTELKSRVNIEKEIAAVYIDRKQFQEAKEHLLIAQTVYKQASKLSADDISKHLLEVAYNKISKLLEQCEEHL